MIASKCEQLNWRLNIYVRFKLYYNFNIHCYKFTQAYVAPYFPYQSSLPNHLPLTP